MQRLDVDGVPVPTAPGPGRITTVLTFGVGLRDETFATSGVTHLIESLVMGAQPESHLDCNAMVDLDLTALDGSGRPEAVRAFLETVCHAITDLPTERMVLEIGVLQAENCAAPGHGRRGPGPGASSARLCPRRRPAGSSARRYSRGPSTGAPGWSRPSPMPGRVPFPVDPAVHGRAACAAIRAHLPEHLWVHRPASAVARRAVPVG